MATTGTNTVSIDSPTTKLDYLVYYLDGKLHTTCVPHEDAELIVANPKVNLMTWLEADPNSSLARRHGPERRT
jgi:hypothetical protein